ncbi:alpha/beta hydrolase [Azohydromonas sp.]|mgnify:FL=1|uniref:alpha/beta fold hydrolase n=1 Tax=Azohydromonas sp. TaxID=1872666 RepID=UPI002C2E1E35|nr:alpha/beta hydrolase [Azohydromonas sp.]HMM86109.1 alpha/beta hydrolase [Azohydromonas sp.]
MKALALKLFGLLLVASAIALTLSRAPDRPVQTLVARWAPPPSQFIELDGQLVHLRDEGPRGDPLPLVLVHGTSASLHTWDGWTAALRGQRRVIRFDLPGFGLTGPSVAGDYRGDTLARFTLTLLDRLQVERFVIGGNSLGGEVAWRVATLAPGRVERLILVDASGPAFEPQSVPVGWIIARVPLANRLLEHLLPRSMVAASVASVYGDPARITPELVDRYFELTLREGNRRALVQRLRQMQGGEDAERIATIVQPTLILWGARDRLIPPAVGRRFDEQIGHSTLVVFDGLGHVPHEEDPARTVRPVLDFLGLR